MPSRDESGPYSLLREPIRPLRTESRHGIGASPGVAVGRAFVIDRRRTKTPKRHIAPEDVEAELVRLDEALALADIQLERLKKRLKEREKDSGVILDAYQLMLHDDTMIGPTRRRIRDEKMNAEWALRKTVEEIKHRFDAIGIEYFRERRSDVDFVGEQVLRNLIGAEAQGPIQPPPGAVVVAHDLSPADTVHLHRNSVAAFVCDAGGRTSHTAILAQAFSIPAVVGLDDITDRIGSGDLVIVDGSRGEVILCPTPDLVEEYRYRALRQHKRAEELLRNRDQPAETRDGVRVRLLANIELPDEVPVALDHGAEGIGLYRTEFLFLDRTDFPREEEHFMHARGVLRRVAPFPATFRTFDLGADKVAPFLAGVVGASQYGPEPNPALGLRSIRLCLKERHLFKTQLRGLLRASVHGRMRLMFPMISGVSELREAKAVLEECKDELRREGLPFADGQDLPVGIMVEMPSAVMVADHLAKEADFLSIGTNDLIQYSLALDRVNEHVGYLYQPLHPAILRMVKQTVEAGHAAGRRVGMCGEMAGEPLFTLVLLGLGMDDLSMNSTSVPLVKSVLRSTTLAEARALAEEVLSLSSAEEIERLVRAKMAGYLNDRDPFDHKTT
jgi:phosphotransferase system enzyme I (PtsI)